MGCTKPQPMILTHCGTRVQLWALGKPVEHMSGLINYKELNLETSVRQVVQLELRLPVYCSSISPSGDFFAASDTKSLFLFSLMEDITATSEVVLRKVPLRTVPTKGIIRITFTANQIILANTRGSIFVVDLKSKEFVEFNNHQCDNRGSIHSLCVSDDGQWLASVDTNNHIHVYNLDVMKHYITLPHLSYPVTAISFSPTDAVLTLACSNSFIYQYDVEAEALTTWSKRHSTSYRANILVKKALSQIFRLTLQILLFVFCPLQHLSVKLTLQSVWTIIKSMYIKQSKSEIEM